MLASLFFVGFFGFGYPLAFCSFLSLVSLDLLVSLVSLALDLLCDFVFLVAGFFGVLGFVGFLGLGLWRVLDFLWDFVRGMLVKLAER